MSVAVRRISLTPFVKMGHGEESVKKIDRKLETAVDFTYNLPVANGTVKSSNTTTTFRCHMSRTLGFCFFVFSST